MADQKISDLTAVTDLDPADEYVLARGGDTNKITGDDLANAIIALAPGGGGLFDAMAILKDVKAQNTNGGTATLGAWRTRDLNTEEDPQGIVVLSSNQFQLGAGTYFLEAQCPSYNIAAQKAKLRNITDSTDEIIGTSEQNQPSGSPCWVIGIFTIAGSKTFEIQHQTQGTQATNGFGVAGNFAAEVYTVVKILRFA